MEEREGGLLSGLVTASFLGDAGDSAVLFFIVFHFALLNLVRGAKCGRQIVRQIGRVVVMTGDLNQRGFKRR